MTTDNAADLSSQPSGDQPWVGRRLPRLEDKRLVRGAGRYIDDVEVDGMLHLRLVRSPIPHGQITGVDVPDDLGDGVTVVVPGDLGTSDRLRARYQPGERPMPEWPLLASERVRYVGEPMLAVLAQDPYAAEDASELVYVDLDALPAHVDPTAPPGVGPPLHAEYPDGVLFEAHVESEPRRSGVVAHTVRRRFRTRRHTGVPMETRGCLAIADGDRVTMWASTQMPHLLRLAVADTLGWDEDRVQIKVPDVGGGFGVKGHVYADEVLVAVLAVVTGRPVKWIEDRNENLVASIHARDHRHDVELDLDADGHILALRADVTIDSGAYPVWPQTASLEAQMTAKVLPGPYRIPSYSCTSRAVATNKAPHGTYRGVARPSAAFSLERLIDEAARELGLDPVEIRMRNLITEFPATSAAGVVYDTGTHVEALAAARDAVAAERAEVTAPGARTLTGVGFASFVEQSAHVPPWALPTSNVVAGPDVVRVSVAADGTISVEAGVNSHGQGQETTLAQVAADPLGVRPADVHVRYGDTDRSPYSTGTLASRSAVVAGNTTAAAAAVLAARLRSLGAAALGVDEAAVRLQGGDVRGPDGGIGFAELAAAHGDDGVLGEDAEYAGPAGGTFSNACHAAVVDVDAETGQVCVRRYVVAEDCGTMINPLVVDGQIMGGVAQGIGSALLEELVYDDGGQLVTATLMDYRLPTTMEVPPVEIIHLASPGGNALGVKGMGESGAIGPMAAIANAVADAVGPERASRVDQVPLLPGRVWQILHEEGR